MTVTPQAALCCLLDAVVESAADAGAAPFDHVYASAAGTWPYCTHAAVVGRVLAPTTEPPDPLEAPTSVWYDVLEVAAVRCGPPFPDVDGACLAALYGSCDSAPGALDLSGHHAAVVEELYRLRLELLERWCSCLTSIVGGGYSSTRPRWIRSLELRTEGRFTAAVFTVATLLR